MLQPYFTCSTLLPNQEGQECIHLLPSTAQDIKLKIFIYLQQQLAVSIIAQTQGQPTLCPMPLCALETSRQGSSNLGIVLISAQFG